ncbi:PLB1 Phospholipase, partial [Horornis vulcanius]|nr:PLB1 Phospholipase [Horornis vulcanius]
RYEQRKDFAVVIQPFFRNTLLPLDSTSKPDMSFFAADCFHFSVRGYAEMAMALWNNMVRGYNLDPCVFVVAVSTKDHEKGEKPFLSTRRNSGFGNSDLSLKKTESSVPYWAVIVTAVAGVLLGSL